jgi:hypothetical protein
MRRYCEVSEAPRRGQRHPGPGRSKLPRQLPFLGKNPGKNSGNSGARRGRSRTTPQERAPGAPLASPSSWFESNRAYQNLLGKVQARRATQATQGRSVSRAGEIRRAAPRASDRCRATQAGHVWVLSQSGPFLAGRSRQEDRLHLGELRRARRSGPGRGACRIPERWAADPRPGRGRRAQPQSSRGLGSLHASLACCSWRCSRRRHLGTRLRHNIDMPFWPAMVVTSVRRSAQLPWSRLGALGVVPGARRGRAPWNSTRFAVHRCG